MPFVVIGLTAGSIYGLAGIGLVLTYKTSGIFNFAHGSMAAAMAYAFYDLRERQGLPWPIAMAVCLFVLSPLVSLLLERVARNLSDAPVVMKVVATVGMIVSLQQLIFLRYGGSIILPDPYLPSGEFTVFGVVIGLDQLIVMLAALGGMVGLTKFLGSRTGRQMRALVDQPHLLSMHGIDPVRVRRRAWLIGTVFTALSGIQLGSTVGLEAGVLTLLVVQAFGAAAIGMFTSIPMTYVGGLAVGTLAAMSTKYVGSITWLAGIPPSIPFIVLFGILIFAPASKLVDFTVERKPSAKEPHQLPVKVKVSGGILLAVLLLRLPYLVGTRLPVFTSAAAYVLIFLSLLLLMRTSGQVSLAQLSFAAVGSVASARLVVEAGVPWVVAVIAGALIAVPVGALLAIPAIRRSGLYLALATFGFAVLLERLVFFTTLMFGANTSALPAPRPSFATSDEAYFYVVLAFALFGVGVVTVVKRSRLGRLLQAMADSPTALNTSGTSLTVIKVAVFCVASYLAALGGALVGPITGYASPGGFSAIAGLVFVVLSVVVVGTEVAAAVGASIALMVLPSYLHGSLHDILPVTFGLTALVFAMSHAGIRAPGWLSRAAVGARRGARSPITARLEASRRVEVA